ncbi:hypothetical protein FA95DRAFT_1603969 [Auriscalpium vulgare]|uniref:Uncharacterized protein n=1 Tax=Auriscalpium vulgare TaxID=40419 RepID=A0ACB8S273_9AGAM|nr:hypothetical protein FA95DRAFT_1603969 [Auriscalpium vulgare]
MQPPTCTGLRVRTTHDAEVVFHAVAQGILPMVERRLDSEERMFLCSGCVYVWEERSSSVSESVDQGIERFTEGRSWGPSRARDDFLFYNEKDDAPKSMMVERTRAIRYQEDPSSAPMLYPRRRGERMIKQTYSVYVNGPKGVKKWHLNAYWTQETLDRLATVQDVPQLCDLVVPPGFYMCARSNRMRDSSSRSDRSGSAESTGSGAVADLRAHAAPYPSQRTPQPAPSPTPSQRDPHSPLCAVAHANPGFPPPPPRPAHGLALAPLDQLEANQLETGMRSWRDPADERMLRKLRQPCH